METPPSSRISTLVPILTTIRTAAATCSRGESSVRWNLVVPMAFLLGRRTRRKLIRHTAIPPARSHNSTLCRRILPQSEWAYRYFASAGKAAQGVGWSFRPKQQHRTNACISNETTALRKHASYQFQDQVRVICWAPAASAANSKAYREPPSICPTGWWS